jgi:hypothetical protein
MSYPRCSRSPLSIADEVFTALQRGPEPLSLHPRELLDADALSFDPAWRSGPIPLLVLRDRLRRASTPLQVKTRAWSVLVGKAQQEGGAWTVGAVGVALPRLVRLATELADGDRDGRPELDSEILTGFLQALSSANPASPQLFPHLLRQARRAGLAWLRHQRAADTPLAESGYSSAPPPRPWGHPDLVLAAAVTAGAITAAEAALIGATRLEGISPHTLAANAQLSDQTLLKRRRRAEHRLIAYLHQQLGHTDTDDPTSTTALSATRLPTDPPAGAGTGRGVGTDRPDGATARRIGRPKPTPAVPSYRLPPTATEASSSSDGGQA